MAGCRECLQPFGLRSWAIQKHTTPPAIGDANVVSSVSQWAARPWRRAGVRKRCAGVRAHAACGVWAVSAPASMQAAWAYADLLARLDAFPIPESDGLFVYFTGPDAAPKVDWLKLNTGRFRWRADDREARCVQAGRAGFRVVRGHDHWSLSLVEVR